MELVLANKPLPFAWADPLPAACAGLLPHPGPIRILDFGGAIGLAFAYLLGRLRGIYDLEFHVVELPNLVEEGRKFWSDVAPIHFHLDIPQFPNGLDVLHLSGVLPYIDDWQGLLKRLLALRPKRVVFSCLAVVDCPSFATRQLNLPGQVLAYWFLNATELKNVVKEEGYELVYERRYGGVYDMSNFPPMHRLEQMTTLWFVRST